MSGKTSLIVACVPDGTRLLVSILSTDEGMQSAIARALEVIAGSAEVSSICPGETVAVDGDVFVAMAPDSPEAADFLRRAASHLTKHDLRDGVDVLVLDLAEDLVRAGLADAVDIPRAEDAARVLSRRGLPSSR